MRICQKKALRARKIFLMFTPLTRPIMLERLLSAVQNDERIVGCVDYGLASESRADEWSDVDVALFVRDADLPAFELNWKTWVAQFERICGDFWYYLLFAYCKFQHGHHWLAREAFNSWAMGNLQALLKFEARAFERWDASSGSWNLEAVISSERLAQWSWPEQLARETISCITLSAH